MTSETSLRLDDKRGRKVKHLRFEPDPAMIARLITEFDLISLKKATLTGELTPVGQSDWELRGRMGASVVQPCVVTLQPVSTRIDAGFERLFVTEMPEMKGGEEIEMLADDRLEPRPAVLELATLFTEVLALELPAWPRAEGAELPAALAKDVERENPFAVLEKLKGTLKEQ